MNTSFKFRESNFIFLIILFCNCIFLHELKAQEISTVGEIYDYEIGDIFHIETDISYGSIDGMHAFENIEILDKFYSSDYDSLFYVRDIAYKEISSINPNWTFDFYIDTVIYSNLDSLIYSGDIDSVYSDTAIYNGRLVNYKFDYDYYTNWKYKYVIGCGLANYYYYYFEFGSVHYEMTKELIYFKKGDEEWGEQIPVSTDNIKTEKKNISLFPNPAKNYFSIVDNDYKVFDLKIISLSGEIVKTIKREIQKDRIDISNIHSGIYIVQISSKDNMIFKKLIVE